jgi:hypothetical protein
MIANLSAQRTSGFEQPKPGRLLFSLGQDHEAAAGTGELQPWAVLVFSTLQPGKV